MTCRGDPLLELIALIEGDVRIVCSRHKLIAVGAEGHAGHSFGVATEHRQLDAFRRVPDPDRLVVTPRDDPPSLAVEREAADPSPMAS